MILKKIVDYFKGLSHYDQCICVGDQIVYKGLSHGSVGISFLLEYDKTAFTEKCTLIALKAGKFVIKEIENFRDEQITVKAVHVIKVRRNRSSC